MKFIKENAGKGVLIPNAALRLSELDEEPLELQAEKGAAILLKRRMTAAELLRAVDGLSRTASKLIVELLRSCGTCDACDPDCLFEEHEAFDDIPANLAVVLARCGLCFRTLRTALEEGSVIYGG